MHLLLPWRIHSRFALLGSLPTLLRRVPVQLSYPDVNDAIQPRASPLWLLPDVFSSCFISSFLCLCITTSKRNPISMISFIFVCSVYKVQVLHKLEHFFVMQTVALPQKTQQTLFKCCIPTSYTENLTYNQIHDTLHLCVPLLWHILTIMEQKKLHGSRQVTCSISLLRWLRGLLIQQRIALPESWESLGVIPKSQEANLKR